MEEVSLSPLSCQLARDLGDAGTAAVSNGRSQEDVGVTHVTAGFASVAL